VSQDTGFTFAVTLPVNRLMFCQSCIARSDSGGVLWKPRAHPHCGWGVQFAGRFAGLEYIAPHIAPPHPASQLSVVWLWMYPTLDWRSNFSFGVMERLVRPLVCRRALFGSAPSLLAMSPDAKYRRVPAPPETLAA